MAFLPFIHSFRVSTLAEDTVIHGILNPSTFWFREFTLPQDLQESESRSRIPRVQFLRVHIVDESHEPRELSRILCLELMTCDHHTRFQGERGVAIRGSIQESREPDPAILEPERMSSCGVMKEDRPNMGG